MKKTALLLISAFLLYNCGNGNSKHLSPLTEQQKVFYSSFENNRLMSFYKNDTVFTLQLSSTDKAETMYKEEKAGLFFTPGAHYLYEYASARYKPTSNTNLYAYIKELEVYASGGTMGASPHQYLEFSNRDRKTFRFHTFYFNTPLPSKTLGGKSYTNVVVGITSNQDSLFWNATEGWLGWKERNGALNYRIF